MAGNDGRSSVHMSKSQTTLQITQSLSTTANVCESLREAGCLTAFNEFKKNKSATNYDSCRFACFFFFSFSFSSSLCIPVSLSQLFSFVSLSLFSLFSSISLLWSLSLSLFTALLLFSCLSHSFVMYLSLIFLSLSLFMSLFLFSMTMTVITYLSLWAQP